VTDLHWESATALAQQVRTGARRASEVLDAHLERIRRVEPKVHAFLRLTEEAARAEAEAVDAKLRAGEDPGPLAGVPLGIKDNICTRGIETTAGSRILEGFRPPYSATCVERLQAAGAVSLGKLNLDEFGMGSSTENSAYGPTRNPWDVARVPGGSSGGSAAAVVAGEVAVSLGTDTGGSIRQPAALCGCVGLKPTYGLVSRYGLVAFASSLDQIGPLARSCSDLALVLDVIWGPDPRDMTSRDPRDVAAEPLARRYREPAPFSAAVAGATLTGKTLGVVRDYLELVYDFPEVREPLERAIEAARSAGAEVREVSLDLCKYAIPAYQIVSTAEASSNLARYDGVHYGHRTGEGSDIVGLYERSRAEGLGPEVKRRIFLGTFVLSSGFYDAYYLKGMRVRRLIREDFLRALDGVDALVGPASPVAAFRFGERADPLAMYAVDVFTVSTNLAGVPALSLPCGFTPDHLPVGLQLTGRHWSDPELLALGSALEQVLLPASGRRPELDR
jgi:aspartyl-tRNA(Asn)/glutamyl-tRNA(Gln) amidotransferase subunit A